MKNMKKSIPEYIKVLSGNDFDVLEEIFIDKYSQILDLYWLISDYSDFVVSMKYKKTKKDVLKIELVLAKISVNKVLEDISESICEHDNVVVWNEKKVIHIEISK